MDVDENELTPAPAPAKLFASPPGRPRKSTGRDMPSPVLEQHRSSSAKTRMDKPCDCGDIYEGALGQMTRY